MRYDYVDFGASLAERTRGPGETPAQMFDRACTGRAIAHRWATIDWAAQCCWLDQLASTHIFSYLAH